MNLQLKSFQHYVPRFLLEYFSSDKLLWVYDRKLNQFRNQSAKNTAGEKAYYVFTQNDGEQSAALEEMFSEIEGVASRLVKDLDVGKQNLDEQGKVDMATFLAVMYLRVPNSFSRTETMSMKMTKEIMSRTAKLDAHFDIIIDEIERKEGKMISKKQREDIQKTFVDKNYDLRFPKEHMLKSMIQMFNEFYIIFAQMEWIIWEAPKNKAFITSDNPAFTFNVKPEGFWGSGLGILAPNCETTVVLTPKLCIFLSQERNPDSIKYIKATSKLVDNINARTAICSSRFLVSHNEALLKKWVRRTSLVKRAPYLSVDAN